MLALIALLAAAPAELTLDIPLYVGAEIDEDVLDSALREVDQIFAPGGIRLRFQISPDVPVYDPTVTVVLEPRPVRFVVHGCSRNRHDHRLGRTSFTAKRITLWSEQIARAVDGDWDRRKVPKVTDTAYARALGRVLAHELGHVFLRSNDHRDDGLMRPSFSHRTLTAKGNRAFRLSDNDLEKMRAALEHEKKERPAPPEGNFRLRSHTTAISPPTSPPSTSPPVEPVSHLHELGPLLAGRRHQHRIEASRRNSGPAGSGPPRTRSFSFRFPRSGLDARSTLTHRPSHRHLILSERSRPR